MDFHDNYNLVITLQLSITSAAIISIELSTECYASDTSTREGHLNMVGDIPHVFPDPRPTSSPTLPVRALRIGRNINVLDGSPFCSGGLHLGMVLSGCSISACSHLLPVAAHPTGRAFPNCAPALP